MSENDQNSIGDFADRLDVLAKEAKSYGLSVAWAVLDCNPLSHEDDMRSGYVGGKWQALGMAVQLQHDLLAGDMA